MRILQTFIISSFQLLSRRALKDPPKTANAYATDDRLDQRSRKVVALAIFANLTQQDVTEVDQDREEEVMLPKAKQKASSARSSQHRAAVPAAAETSVECLKLSEMCLAAPTTLDPIVHRDMFAARAGPKLLVCVYHRGVRSL